ncbi:MAG: hypothetical protein AB7N73_14555 [Gemmatimonadales bacterium]
MGLIDALLPLAAGWTRGRAARDDRRRDDEITSRREAREEERLRLARDAAARDASTDATRQSIWEHDQGLRDRHPVLAQAALAMTGNLGMDGMPMPGVKPGKGPAFEDVGVPGKVLLTDETPTARAVQQALAQAEARAREKADDRAFTLYRDSERERVADERAAAGRRSGGGGGGAITTPKQALDNEDDRRKAMIAALKQRMEAGRGGTKMLGGRSFTTPDDPRLGRMQAVSDSLTGEIGAPAPAVRTNPLDEFAERPAAPAEPVDPRKAAYLEARRTLDRKYAAAVAAEPERAKELQDYYLEALQLIDAEHGVTP